MAARGRKAASYNIPPDLYGEILYRLPSRDLLRFKLVCKDWLRLISSKEFIQKHLERSKADCNHLRIVVNSDCREERRDCANNTSKEILSFDHDEMHLLGCCDGLVLYYDGYLGKIAALNPCTRESLLLVPMPNQYGIKHRRRRLKLIFSWFGHHPSTGEYVLVLAYRESGIIKFKVYSLSLDRDLLLLSSSTLDQLHVGISDTRNCNEIGTLLHGRLHCPAVVYDSGGQSSVGFVILVYDFETNKIMRMTPAVQHDVIRVLGVVDGCLCAIQYGRVWIMKEYGVKESWTEYAHGSIYGSPMAFSPNGDVIIASYDHGFRKMIISKYSLREREAKFLCESTTANLVGDPVATACIDSLVSPTVLSKEDE